MEKMVGRFLYIYARLLSNIIIISNKNVINTPSQKKNKQKKLIMFFEMALHNLTTANHSYFFHPLSFHPFYNVRHSL